jgi:hypothetical protein
VNFPVSISTGGAGYCKSQVIQGTGKRLVAAGAVDELLRESFDVAISFACLNAPLLRAWVTGTGKGANHANLFNSRQDLTVGLYELDQHNTGNSAAACVALSLACLLGK